MAKLTLNSNDEGPREFPLTSERAVLGRHPSCDMVLRSGRVSRQHAEIVRQDGTYFVADLHSIHGTMVNGEPVIGRRALEHLDRVEICGLMLLFQSDSPSQPTQVVGQTRLDDTVATEEPAPGTGSSPSVVARLDVSRPAADERAHLHAEVKLKAMVEIGQNLKSVLALDGVLEKVLDSLFRIFPQCDFGFIALGDAPGEEPIPRAVRSRHPGPSRAVRLSRTIVDQALSTGQAILSADAAQDDRFRDSRSAAALKLRSVLCTPLIAANGDALGVLQLETSDDSARFRQDALDVLASIGAQVTVAIENARLHEAAVRTRVIDRDIGLAQQFQRGLLPAMPPQVAGYEFLDAYEAAPHVSADYYDYIPLPGGRMAVVMADFWGRGIPATLLMARISAETRYCLLTEADPAAALARVNASFVNSEWEDRFVTFVLCVVDTVRHVVTVVNAGHTPPLLRRADGRVEDVNPAEADFPLGFEADTVFHSVETALGPGDSMLLFTDGVREAVNVAGEAYGVDRPRMLLAASTGRPAEIVPALMADVKQFAQGRPLADDRGLIGFWRLP
jgi:sigma-B regulation protein RsbU (phosphoserine phosphatase)